MQLGHPSPSGPRGLPAQPHQMDHWLSIVWGRAFLRAFLAESRSLLQPVESHFLSQYIFALSNPSFPSGYLYINAVPLFQDYLCLTLFFMVLSNPEHFYDELFLFAFIALEGLSHGNQFGSPLTTRSTYRLR